MRMCYINQRFTLLYLLAYCTAVRLIHRRQCLQSVSTLGTQCNLHHHVNSTLRCKRQSEASWMPWMPSHRRNYALLPEVEILPILLSDKKYVSCWQLANNSNNNSIGQSRDHPSFVTAAVSTFLHVCKRHSHV